MTKLGKTLLMVISLTLAIMLMIPPAHAMDDIKDEIDFTIEADPMANIIPEEIEFTLDLDMEEALNETIQTGSVDVIIQNNAEVTVEFDQEPNKFEDIEGLDSNNLLDKGIYYYVYNVDDETYETRFGPGDTGESYSIFDAGEKELEIQAKFGTYDMHDRDYDGLGDIEDDDVPLDESTLEDKWYELPAEIFEDVILEITIFESS